MGLKWIDTNKGSAEAPRYRPPSGVYGGAPQECRANLLSDTALEALRVLLCVACQEDISRVEDPFLISTAEVSRAHFYADAVRDVCPIAGRGPKGKGARRVWKTTKDHLRILGRCSTVGRTLCTCLGGGRIFPRRGVSVPFLPQKLANLHPSARWADVRGESMHEVCCKVLMS